MNLQPVMDYATDVAFVSVTTVIILVPALRYVYSGWKYKSQDVTSSMNTESKRIYLDKFLKRSEAPANAEAVFFKLYHGRFGRRHFIVPLCVITILTVLEGSVCIESLRENSKFWAPLKLNSAALAGIAGAYMWVVGDFIWRARRMDFSPADILWGSLRLFIAAPLGLSLGSIIIKESAISFVAFGLGAFPLETIQSFLRQLSAKSLGIDLGSTQNSELLKLQGVDQAIVDRLIHEDITSVCQLAYCDPIQLTMRSNLSFNTVVDLVSQALAWIYIDDKLNLIRPLGLRGAYEIRDLLDDLGNSGSVNHTNAQSIIPELARRLDLDQDKMWNVITTIAYDPYTDFLYRTWS
jgi:hypothetical protein